jgi:hypothetical protein
MLIKTANSTYEIDVKEKRLRRLEGIAAPTKRVPVDGEWKPYQKLAICQVGEPLLVVWSIIMDKGEAVNQSTVTSPIVEIIAINSYASGRAN